MIPVDTVQGVAGAGLEGDCQRKEASPRQVLVFSHQLLQQLSVPHEAVRANILVDGFIDNLPSGTVLRVGKNLALRLTMRCEPCRKLESHRRGLAHELRGCRGMLARVVLSGTARVRERVAVSLGASLPLHASWQDRVADIVQSLPDGMLLSYARLALLAGVQTSYCRAFPRVLRNLRTSSPGQVRRIVSSGNLANRGETDELFWDGAGYYRDQESALIETAMRYNKL